MSDLHDWGTGEAPKPPRPDYVPKVALFPQTLDDLMNRAGPYADATKAYVEWGAVTVWFMKDADKALASAFIPIEVASLSIVLVREAVRIETGWPCLSGTPVTPELYDLPDDAQQIARRMAADIHDLWKNAGRPYLRPSDFKYAFQYLAAAIRKGIIPPVAAIADADPIPAAKPARPHILDMFKETT
ncbi:hypothetical protein [Sphingomonas sp. dw_22]|uniref:hypothetical protein n=1 Tax=Sphingomonas sp. dw_22 TaxID=2721175 RepID=UPI001BD236E2|nr:hypothetical protein [Sphingomonas sp. dw_22]